MARSEHNREAYRQLFGFVGAGLQALALMLILISFPIAPAAVILVLLAALIGLSVWSWRAYASNFMMPTFVGVGMSAIWMLVVGLGAMLLGWGP